MHLHFQIRGQHLVVEWNFASSKKFGELLENP
jgi:hypothetical protein